MVDVYVAIKGKLMSRVETMLRLLRWGFAFRRPTSPPILIFHVTTRCNMRCRHCGDDVWGDPENDLSFKDIKQFSANIGELQDLAIGGGEPFLRRDLPEICDIFAQFNKVKNLCIPTNGFATELICNSIEQILASCQQTNIVVSLSLDGFQDTHDKIRMPGSFDRVMVTANELMAIRQQSRNFTFFFNATINSINCYELPGLAEYVQERFQTHLDFNLLTGTPRDETITLPTLEKTEQAVDGIYAARHASALLASQIRIGRNYILRTNAEGRQIVPCRAGSLIAVVDANGDVRSCTLLPVLGNLRDRSFSEIWQSPLARRQHKWIVSRGCSCNNDCFVVNNLNNYWKLPFLMLRQEFSRIFSKT